MKEELSGIPFRFAGFVREGTPAAVSAVKRGGNDMGESRFDMGLAPGRMVEISKDENEELIQQLLARQSQLETALRELSNRPAPPRVQPTPPPAPRQENSIVEKMKEFTD